MKNFFKTFSFLLVILSFASCGKTSRTSTYESKSTINGYSVDNLTTSVLSVPSPDMIGGGVSIQITGKSYQIDTSASSTIVQQYLAAIAYGQAQVTPISQDRYATKYRVAYAGSLQEGSCTFNPGATCTNAVLTQLIAY